MSPSWLPNEHDKYDDLFARAIAERFGAGIVGEYDDPIITPLQLKAQAIQESQLKPTAISHAGARGLMQIMPRTGVLDLEIYGKIDTRDADVSKRERMTEAEADDFARFFDPWTSVRRGLEYMTHVWRYFHSCPDKLHRWYFALGSYNAGAGYWLRARNVAIERGWDANDFFQVALCLQYIPRVHWQEPLRYVPNIQAIHRKLLALEDAEQ